MALFSHATIFYQTMTTTILELLANLKHYPSATKVTIKDVDDEEYAIVDFEISDNTLTITIGQITEADEEDEEDEE